MTTTITENPQRGGKQFRIATPAHWISLDTASLLEWKARAGDIDQPLKDAIQVIELAAEAFNNQGVLYAAMLAEPGNAEALATVAAYAVAFPKGAAPENLVAYVADNPPRDALPESFVAREAQHDLGRCVWSRCLRKSILELPSRSAVSLSVEYIIELAQENALLLTAFTTPNVRQSEQYEELFASIVATIDVA